MTDTEKRAKATDKARKIKAMADSASKIGNEAEAQAFAAKLTQMMAEHNLGFSDLEWEEERKVVATKACYEVGKTKIMGWESLLASIIAEGNSVGIYIQTGYTMGGHKYSAQFVFVGLETNVTAALKTMEYLHPAAKRIAHVEYNKKYDALYAAKADRSCMKGYEGDFLLGFVVRLRERYNELRESMRTTSCTALVRLSDALTVAKSALEEMNLRKGSKRDTSVTNFSAYADGKKKANEMNIGGSSLHKGDAAPAKATAGQLR
jgi:Protein of unknown function (DUF2786)